MKGCIAQIRSANKNYRHMRTICGVDDERKKRAKDIYFRKNEEARQEHGRDFHVHNGMVIKIYVKEEIKVYMKMLIEKGKETNDSNVKLMNVDGEAIAHEKKVKGMIELGLYFVYFVRVFVDGGMRNEVWSINDQDLKRTIKLMKEKMQQMKVV